MQSNFMFLFLTFFLIVTFSTFDSDGNRNQVKTMRHLPLATISKIEPMIQKEEEEVQPLERLPYSAFTTEVQFKKGKLTVPLSAKKEIKEMFYRARREGKIKAAKIISWADQALPLKKKKSLSSAQLKLVEDRNDSIEAYLERLDLRMVVGKISMAERPEVMEGILSREDRKLRRSFENSQDPNLSKSIVMFILKNDATK